jgi:hypothetical protein
MAKYEEIRFNSHERFAKFGIKADLANHTKIGV